MNNCLLIVAAALPLLLASTSGAQSPSTPYTALYVFGASFSDTANGPADAIHYWQRRWSNGPMWPEFLSTNLGFAYRAQNNRAVGGHTSSQILGQVRTFTPPANAASAVFSVELGYNDFTTLSLNNAQIWTNIIGTAILNWSNSIVACYEKGARSVIAFNFVDLNFFPGKALVITDAAAVRNRIVEANTRLKLTRQVLGLQYPDLRLIAIDHFGAADVLATNYTRYAFTHIRVGALDDPQLLDKSFSGPGRFYFFWDAGHVTSKAHGLFADLLFAALHGARLGLAPEVGGLRLSIEPLQIGRSYQLEESSDLLQWNAGDPFVAADRAHELLLSPVFNGGYYRLRSEN